MREQNSGENLNSCIKTSLLSFLNSNLFFFPLKIQNNCIVIETEQLTAAGLNLLVLTMKVNNHGAVLC